MIYEPTTTHLMRERLAGIMGRAQLADRAIDDNDKTQAKAHLALVMVEAHRLAALVAEVEKL
jgi:nitrogen-specific signal transduction histidine kinase